MDTMVAIAPSGAQVSAARSEATDSNIANRSTSGPLPTTPRAATSNVTSKSLFQPIGTVQVTLPGGNGAGGVGFSYVPTRPAFYATYNPGAPGADAYGMVAMPDISLAMEMVNQSMAMQSYEANAAIINPANEPAKKTLDLVS